MSLFRISSKSSLLIKMAQRSQGIASILCDTPRHFSTEAGKPKLDISYDSFLEPPSTGLVYGRLTGIRKHTTKSDIINLLDSSKLSLDDVKVDYNRNYSPMAMLVQFPSPEAYDAGIRSVVRKGRIFKLERTGRNQWDQVKPYDGKAILLQGIPRRALLDDIERFLSGCEYDSSSITFFMRPAFPDPIRTSRVHFPSRTLAMHAFITKNRGFCLDSQILVEVLQ
ncbi:hypothetical protein M9H77_03276 [Catharanthus roseus]|uniref:Uncharacterized protein n=1 Tax=Catharanthus roseus TaxID=4058 RepID=A0ACC0CB96_CATRO|nr:hypothetical protein M9H77_03276 [Catharanthus roseus]